MSVRRATVDKIVSSILDRFSRIWNTTSPQHPKEKMTVTAGSCDQICYVILHPLLTEHSDFTQSLRRVSLCTGLPLSGRGQGYVTKFVVLHQYTH